ncbi:hypothetical protein LDENG_00204210 [Lucifuga dentata]|nr:hypothetical protein LDENG_00204210 [Lucifuga dentata]
MRDVLELCKPGTLRFGVFSLDQEKAFDRVGGGLSRPVQVKQGIRQGCPLSGQLYSLAIEPMLCLLRMKLQGLTISAAGLSNPLFLSAYAVDLNIFIRNEEDVRAMEFCLRAYQKASSARVNWEKSEALLCGDWSGVHPPPLPGGLCWKDTGLKMLGVYLGSDTWVRKNWEDAVQLVEKKLTKWKWLLRQLSYRGRVLIINNLVASSLWHRLAVLNPPCWSAGGDSEEAGGLFLVWTSLVESGSSLSSCARRRPITGGFGEQDGGFPASGSTKTPVWC